MGKPEVTVFLGISLDGYIAGEGGDLSWLSVVESDPPEETGYNALMNRVDTLVLGRNTYDTILGFEAWPYSGKRVVVMTHRELASRHGEAAYDGTVPDLLKTLGAEGCGHVYLDGGTVVREGLAAGVVDEMILSWIPVILGGGIPLFRPGVSMSHWRLEESRVFPSALLQGRYLPCD